LQRTAYIGDDVNDLPALQIAGLSVAPANAQPEVRAAATLVLKRGGGHGAVRELVEMMLAARSP
jgi:N-acylneuraminate cytidylyltransferase